MQNAKEKEMKDMIKGEESQNSAFDRILPK